tara:strand:+ start:1587 stop:1820 length:234 start_codon:yes stop_codon:yes gene_type:complete
MVCKRFLIVIKQELEEIGVEVLSLKLEKLTVETGVSTDVRIDEIKAAKVAVCALNGSYFYQSILGKYKKMKTSFYSA